MKKLLLALMAAAAFSASAQTMTLDKSNALQAPAGLKDAPAMAPSRADDGYTLRFCQGINGWNGFNAAGTYVQYITIPADIATELAGNKVSSISFSICLGGSSATITRPGTIFVTENPNSATIAGLTFEAESKVTIRNSYYIEPYYQTGTFTSGEEYVIKENTPFSFGLMYDMAATDYPVGYDGMPANNFAGTVAVYQNGNLAASLPLATELGTNLMMYAVTKGEKTELLDMASVLGARMDGFTLPVFSGDKKPGGAYVAINNMGSNSITSVNFTYSVNGGEFTTADAQVEVPGGKAMWAPVGIEGLPAGHNELTLKVNKLNGKDVLSGEYKMNYIDMGAAQAYDRNFVVEEFTGTWCGYCPRGIVGMDYMQENYPERFIGIAVHASTSGASDKFQVANYLPFVSEYATGFPSFIANRDPYYLDDPDPDVFTEMYNIWLGQAAPAEVAVDYEVDDKTLNLKATTTFAIDDNHPYNIAFVLTEDGLTGYQTNYYAGGDLGAMGGWESKATKVNWTYTHTAIRIDAAFGNELGTAFEAGKSYEAAASFAYIGAMNKKQFNLDNTHAIALLMDAETGVVLNATKIDLQAPTDGIDDAIAMPEGPTTYYNVQGQKVANPQAGQLYIRLQDGQATKVVY